MKKVKRPKCKVSLEWEYYNDDPAKKTMYKAYKVFMKALDKLEPIKSEQKGTNGNKPHSAD